MFVLGTDYHTDINHKHEN